MDENETGTPPPQQRDAITASEIGDFVYCHRSWWFALHETPSLSAPMLEQGTATHVQIGRQLQRSERLARRGRCLLLAGCLLVFVIVVLALLHPL